MLLDDLERDLDRLAGSDPFSYADPESVIALERLAARLEFCVAQAVAAFDAGGEWAADGAKGTAAWLSTRCHLPQPVARAQLRRGRALPQLPVSAEAFSAGEIGVAQLDALAQAASGPGPGTAEAFARDEALLVEHAKGLKFAPFRSVLAYWTQLADPEGAQESDLERRARRDVYLNKSINDMYLGAMTLDPVSGAIVSKELVRLEEELFAQDWAKAKAELGRDPKLHELWRTSAQHRADAMVEMAIRSASAPADAKRPEPLFSVLVGWETLYGRICELADGSVLSPTTLVPWMDGASFERIVFAPGRRVEVSVRSRFFTGATRRAIEVRDYLGCTHEYCEEPAENCQIDHIVPYTEGGETTQENGRVLCGFHNRLRNGREPPDPDDDDDAGEDG
jgi:hypothetical protein